MNYTDIRQKTINGQTYFVGVDVARILGYTSPKYAVNRYVHEEDQTDGMINPTGVQSLISAARSRTNIAAKSRPAYESKIKDFELWFNEQSGIAIVSDDNVPPIDNGVQVFFNRDFGNIRGIEIGGEPWLVGKDVAAALGYGNTRKAILDHVESEDKNDGVTIRDSIGRDQKPVLINESGLYSLIFGSKLPSAKKFKHWVTSEVLPAIRKHGGYLTPEKIEEALLNPDVLIRLATDLKTEREKRIAMENVNKALIGNVSVYEDNRKILNRLMNRLAYYCYHGNYAHAKNAFYVSLGQYDGINLKIRRAKSTNGNKALLDYLKDDEYATAIRRVVIMLKRHNIGADDILAFMANPVSVTEDDFDW